MIKTHVIQLFADAKVAICPQFRRFPVRIQYDRHGIPSRQGANAMLQLMIAGGTLLLIKRYGIQIRGNCALRQIHTRQVRFANQLADQKMGPLCAFILQYRIQCIQPLLCFL